MMAHYDKKERRDLAVYLLVFFLSAVALIVTGVLSYRDFEAEFREQAEHQMSSFADLKVTELEVWRKERMVDAEFFFHNQAFSALVELFLEDPADARVRAQLLTWLEHYQTFDQYDQVSLLDVNGEGLLSVGPPMAVKDPGIADDVAESLRFKDIMFGDFRRAIDGRIYLNITVPIFSGRVDGNPIGVLVLRVDPQKYLYPYIQTTILDSSSAETLLVRRDGDDILFLNELRFISNASLNLRIPLIEIEHPAVRAVLGEQGIVEGVDYRGEAVLADLRPIPNSPWFLISKMDIAEIHAPLRIRLRQTVSLFGLAIFSAGAILITFWRQQRIQFYRSQAESALALRESEERYRWVVSNIPVVTFATDEKGIFTLSEGKGLDKLGLRPGQIVGQSIFELYEESTGMLEAMRSALAGQEIRNEVTIKGVHFDVFYTPLFDQNGKVVRVIGLANDVTSHKVSEDNIRQLNLDLEHRVRERTAQFEAANKELEAFSYSVSHDLRAPLRGINGWSQALLEDYQDKLDDQGVQYIQRVLSETRRMGNLIDGMLNLSRLTRTEMIKKDVNLSAVAETIVERLKRESPFREVEFLIEPGLVARGDPNLMEVVLANLLENAFKFTSKKARSLIEFGRLEVRGCPTFFVKDNGAGFDSSYALKLFGAFQRMHKSSEFPGTGIGLATVQRIVHRHGGVIWAESKVDAGATFFFTLE